MTVTSRSNHRSRLGAALMLAGLAFALGGSSALAQGTSASPAVGSDTPVASSPVAPGAPDPSDGATVAVPQDGLTHIQPTAWDHVDVSANGQTLAVYYWSGVDTCYGLASVDTTVQDGVLDIQLRTGTLPGVDACIEMAQYYQTVIQLDEPLITGGHLE